MGHTAYEYNVNDLITSQQLNITLALHKDILSTYLSRKEISKSPEKKIAKEKKTFQENYNESKKYACWIV